MEKNNIQLRPIWTLNHNQIPYIKNQKYRLSKCFYHFENTICLPSSSNLSYKEIVYIAKAIKSYLKKINY